MVESLDTYIRKKIKRENLEEFFGPLDEEMEQKFNADWHYDFIGEMLNTYDAEKLISRLKEKYGKHISDITRENRGSKENFEIVFNDIQTMKDLLVDDNFLCLISFFNYYVTYKDFKYRTVYCEPTYSDVMSSDEFMKCNGIFFHIAKSKLEAASIVSKGLRCRGWEFGDKKYYRDFPKKNFLIAFDGVKNLKGKIKEFVLDLFGSKNQFEDAVVLKINLRNKPVTIYKDYAMKGRNDCYFTYDIIPPGCIDVYMNVSDIFKASKL